MFAEDVREKVQRELAAGRKAREDGFEGRARVCARRAAGEAARAFLRQRGLAAVGSAYDLLKVTASLVDAPGRAREAAGRLTLKVNEDFALPASVDLLEEALAFFQALDEQAV